MAKSNAEYLRDLYQSRRDRGLCARCGKQRALKDASRCEPCLIKVRLQMRKAGGHEPWAPGNPGRPPLVNDDDA